MSQAAHDGDTAGINVDHRQPPSHEPKRDALTELPTVDIAPFLRDGDPQERVRTAQALRSACIDIGFFYLKGHGIPTEVRDAVLARGLDFFARPLAEKMEVASSRASLPGYVRTGGIDPEANRDKVVDLKENFSMARELAPGEAPQAYSKNGLSVWPRESSVPGFEATMKDYIARLLELSAALNRAFALSLDLPERHFEDDYRYPETSLTLNYYPPIDRSRAPATQWSISPHADYSAFTILLQDNSGGLQALNASGAWIDVPPKPGAFVVNVGNVLARWTNGLYPSTLHRGLHTGSAPRISSAFFIYPHLETVVRCLETCQGPGNPPRFEDVVTGEYLNMLREQAARAGRPAVTHDAAERLTSAQGSSARP